jgi:hypothetical protein
VSSWFIDHFLDFLKRKYPTGENEMSVLTWLKSLEGKIHDLVVSLFGPEAPQKLEDLAKTIFRQDVLPIFEAGVKEAAQQPLSGAEKLAYAGKVIAPQLEALGISLAKSGLNWGIETVLQLAQAKGV